MADSRLPTTSVDRAPLATPAPPAPLAPHRPRPVARTSLAGDVRALWIYTASRLIVFATAAVASIASRGDVASGPWPTVGTGGSILRALARWDGAWYLAIARHGYSMARVSVHGGRRELAFFPLFPLLVRATSAISAPGTSAVAVAVSLSLVFGGLAAVALWRLTNRIAGHKAADRAVALVFFFPAAFVLSMAYAEALFILTACVALLALLERRWWLAGVSTALAGLTRPTGMALVAACLAVALVEVTRRRDYRSLLAPIVGLIGPLSYWAFVWVRTGDYRGWLDVEHKYWGDSVDFGVGALTQLVHAIDGLPIGLRATELNPWIEALGVVFAVTALVLLIRQRTPLPVLVFGIGAFAFAMSSARVGPRPRMLLAAFPLIVAVAIGVRGRWYWLLLAASTVTMVLLALATFLTLAATP
jgi:hypothetical protein